MEAVEEGPKTPHATLIKFAIILVLCAIDQVKITTQEPKSRVAGSELSQIIKKFDLFIVLLWSIDDCNPPWIGNRAILGHLSRQGEATLHDISHNPGVNMPTQEDPARNIYSGDKIIVKSSS